MKARFSGWLVQGMELLRNRAAPEPVFINSSRVKLGGGTGENNAREVEIVQAGSFVNA